LLAGNLGGAYLASKLAVPRMRAGGGGAVFVLVLGNVLNLMGVSFFIGLMLKGAIIIGLVALDGARGRSA